MKRRTAIAVALSLAISSQQVFADDKKKKPSALSKLRVTKDEMRDLSFFQDPSSPKYRNANGLYLYFSKDASGEYSPIRLLIQYESDSWLFVKTAWAKADGVRIDLPTVTNRMGWERDNGGGSIWEWSDTPLIRSTEIDQIRKLAFSKSATVRFEGRQYYDDRKLTPKQLNAMRNVIAAYEEVTGKPWQ